MNMEQLELWPELLPPNDVMVMINGKSFHCRCGCNVFHHPDLRSPNLFECNDCYELYEDE